jgi:hypothetical protein
MKKSFIFFVYYFVLVSLFTIFGCTKAITEEPTKRVSAELDQPGVSFQADWANVLDSTSSNLSYSRASQATYFDVDTQRIVTAGVNDARFVKAPGSDKLWGEKSGLLLEGATTNLLTDSSFESLSAWTFTGPVTQEAGVGVHGNYGLYVDARNGRVTIEHSPVQVKIYPENFLTYWLSLYVRRVDGGAITTSSVQCSGRPSDPNSPWDTRQIVQSTPVRLGDGPWYRVSAFVGYVDNQRPPKNPTNPFIHSFTFDGNEYYVDAAQLEWAGGNQNSMTQ